MKTELPTLSPVIVPRVTSRAPSARERLRDFGHAPRIVALDIARGLAVLGMAAAHTVPLPGEFRWDDPATWVELVSGRSSILFALLAGISIAIMTGRSRIPAGAELAHLRLRLVTRGLVIFAIGLTLELLGTSIAVILTFYGAVYAVAVLFIGMRVRSLLLWAAALALAGPALSAGLIALSPSSSGAGISFVLGGTYSIVVWSALMLGGLALGRLDVTAHRTAALALITGIVLLTVGYTAGAVWDRHLGGDGLSSSASWNEPTSAPAKTDLPEVVPGADADLTGMLCEDYGDGYLSCYPEDEGVVVIGEEPAVDPGNGWASYPDAIAATDVAGTMVSAFLSSGAHSGGTMEILGSGGFALAIVGILLLTGQALRYVLLPLAAVGAMPLTAYTAHVIVIWAVGGPGGWVQSPLLYGVLAAGLILACTAWAILVGRGPLEHLTAWASDRLAPRLAAPEAVGTAPH